MISDAVISSEDVLTVSFYQEVEVHCKTLYLDELKVIGKMTV